jgi:predicted secreted protein
MGTAFSVRKRDHLKWLGPALALAVSFPAFAGDSAQFDAIGYSEDGRYFAFEQFGIQDGSGFAYAEIFLIDLTTDSFVGGAPFETRIDNEMTPVAAARAEAFSDAQSALAEFGISRPAVPIAQRGDGELDDDGLSIAYGIPSYGLAEIEGEYALNLEIFKAPSSQDCSFFEGSPMGVAVMGQSNGITEEIYRDTRVPASRHCVITYKFYGIFNPFGAWDNSSAVAVFSVWSHGFEGPDRRFIALPVGDAE